jgi:hypothetical protein
LPRRSCDIEGNWAVVAALAEKTATKETVNGKKYGIWCASVAARARDASTTPLWLHCTGSHARLLPCRTLTDLDGTTVRLFLFGEAFAEHWKARAHTRTVHSRKPFR